MDAVTSEDLSDSSSSSSFILPPLSSDDNAGKQQVYCVPYRWWKDSQQGCTEGDVDGVVYLASAVSGYAGPIKIINSIFNSDLVVSLRKEEESRQNNESADAGVSGRDFALVSGEMWLRALKWHSDTKSDKKQHRRSLSAAKGDMSDVYPLQLRLSVLKDSLALTISKRDNSTELFKRACKIFIVEPELLRIWDFSAQLTLYFTYDKTNFPTDNQKQSDQELLLELQVYGLSDMESSNGKKDEMVLSLTNGSVCESGSLGLTGLTNLGNTCFMNNAVQCLAHTPKLVDYFLGDYNREIYHENPLGMDGEIALAFGDLIRKLRASGAGPVAPQLFKSKLARFAPQFSGYNQHDSQELLAFLLDGLHEDLNRVKCKPYAEVKDGDNRPDEEVADEYWQNHLARNDSIIVDVCQGQYKSTLVCLICKRVPITFDPFMYLSLPLPSTAARTMTVTVMTTDGSAAPLPYTVTVPKSGKFVDLIQALSNACSLGSEDSLLVAEIYTNRIIRFLEDPADSLSLIRDFDCLVAYRIPKDAEKDHLFVFLHQQSDGHYIDGRMTLISKVIGVPLVTTMRDSPSGSEISRAYSVLLRPFITNSENWLNDSRTSLTAAPEENLEIEDASDPCTDFAMDLDDNQKEIDSPSESTDLELQFYSTDEKGTPKDHKIKMTDSISDLGSDKRCYVFVSWPKKLLEQYDMQLLKELPEVFKCNFLARKPQESVSLYNCLEAFLKEEPLGPEDMWYCPECKEHRQASKKLDLWRLPEILVIHLKRFSYSRYTKNKLETYVDFPVDDLDLSSHIACKNGGNSTRYMLYAISNHYGSMGGGHYTAYVHHGGHKWYDFDDSRVYHINKDKIKSSAAYVLFYRSFAVHHLDYLGVQVAWVTGPWFLSIFMNMLPWESVLRVWDVLLYEGNRVMLFRTALALMELYGPALVTAKDAGDAVTLLQSLASSTFDSSQLVLTACMGYQNVNEARLQELREKHRPFVMAATEERARGLQRNDSRGLASKLYKFKQDPGSLILNTNGDIKLENSDSTHNEFLMGMTRVTDVDSPPGYKEKIVWLKVELSKLLEEKRSAELRSDELEAALMEMVKQDNRRQLSARLEEEVARLQQFLSDKQEEEHAMLQVLMRVEQEQRLTEDARRFAEQEAVALRHESEDLQRKYEDAIALLEQVEKKAVMAESMLEATLQYQSGQLKAQPSPRSVPQDSSPVGINQEAAMESPSAKKITLLSRPFGLNWGDRNKNKSDGALETNGNSCLELHIASNENSEPQVNDIDKQ